MFRPIVKTVLLLVLAVVVAAPAIAQDNKKQDNKKQQNRQRGNRGTRTNRPILERLSYLKLTDEQTKKLEKLQKDYNEKYGKIRESLTAIYTDEYRQAIRAAFQKAREKGLEGDALREAIGKAGNLTDAQRKVLTTSREMRTAFEKSVNAVLTKEQQAERTKRRGQRGNRQGGGNRPRTKRPDA